MNKNLLLNGKNIYSQLEIENPKWVSNKTYPIYAVSKFSNKDKIKIKLFSSRGFVLLARLETYRFS